MVHSESKGCVSREDLIEITTFTGVRLAQTPYFEQQGRSIIERWLKMGINRSNPVFKEGFTECPRQQEEERYKATKSA